MILSLYLAISMYQQPLDASRIEMMAINSRSGIRAIDISARVETVIVDARPQIVPKEIAQHHIWDDGVHYRADRQSDRAPPDSFHLICDECERPGNAIMMSGPKGKSAVEFLSKANAKRIRGFRAMGFDPRTLGCFLGTLLNTVNSDDRSISMSVSLTEGLSPRTALSGEWRGRPAYILTSKYIRTNADVTTTIIPSMNHSVVEMMIDLKAPDAHNYRNVRQSELAQLPDSDIWYPKTTTFRQEVDGKPVVTEIVTVTSVEINKPIPPSVFTLAGLELPDGQLVMMVEPPGQPMMWSGGKLKPFVVPEDRVEDEDLPIPVVPQRPDWPYYLYTISAGLLAVLAVTFVRRAVARRPR